MKAIVAVDENWAIGRNGELLVHLSGDLKYFKRQTMGKTVVMGRKTLESFPGGRPLPDRHNIVLTAKGIDRQDVNVCRSIDELNDKIRKIGDSDTHDIFVIGGGSVYAQLLPYCDEALVTKIKDSFKADTYFPNLDENDEWELVSESDINTDNNTEYTWCVYRRK